MGWIIAGAVIILILLLLLCKITVIFDYRGDIYLKISYLCFTIFKIPAKRAKTVKKDRKSERSAKAAEKAADDIAKDGSAEKESGVKSKSDSRKRKRGKTAGKKTLSDIYELVKLILDSLGKPLKKLLKRTEIRHFRLEIICGGEDAAAAALNFGRTNIIVGGALGFLDSFFTLKPADDIYVGVDFANEETVSRCGCEIRLTLAAAVVFLFALLGRAVRYYNSHDEVKPAVRKFI